MKLEAGALRGLLGRAAEWVADLSLNSLAFRLIAVSAAWTLVVLPVTGALLSSLYRQEFEESFNNRLELALTALLAGSLGEALREPQTPRDFGSEEQFGISLSGWYWLVKPADGKPGKVSSSPSLVGGDLEFPADRAETQPGRLYRMAVGKGPAGELVRMLERQFTFPTSQRRYSYIVTGNLSDLEDSVARFRNRLAIALTVLGLGLVTAPLFQVRYGLWPLRAMQRGLADIRSGKARRLDGDFPSEIVPLQRELNALITSNEDIIERARTHVGNLAHALKTPLSVITNEAQADQGALARKVGEQAEVMRRQITHHLDRARMVARTGGFAGITEVRPIAEGLVRVLSRVHAERGLAITVDCDPQARFQGEKQDLEELLGNLLDNACKWSTSRVRLTVHVEQPRSRHAQKRLTVEISDDGPGLKPEDRAAAVKRGRRLDETKPGSGLGLSIVADLVALYQGTFELAEADIGGLCARLTLPAA